VGVGADAVGMLSTTSAFQSDCPGGLAFFLPNGFGFSVGLGRGADLALGDLAVMLENVADTCDHQDGGLAINQTIPPTSTTVSATMG
jgi:hypothetical protein